MLATFIPQLRASGPGAFGAMAASAGLALAVGCADAADRPLAGAPLAGIQREALTAADLVGLAGEDDGLDVDDFDAWSELSDDEEGRPSLEPQVSRTVSRLARRLRDDGQLAEGEWHLGTAPPDEHTYARIDLDEDDDGVLDGYHTAAWVPIDATGQPAGGDVYMVRQGGIAGWRFTAGPFTLPASDGIELDLEDAGRPLTVPMGSRLVVRLPHRDGLGARWEVTGEGLAPSHTEVVADDQELVAAYDLAGLDAGDYAVDLERRAEGAAGVRFRVPLTIEADDDDLAGVDAW